MSIYITVLNITSCVNHKYALYRVRKLLFFYNVMKLKKLTTLGLLDETGSGMILNVTAANMPEYGRLMWYNKQTEQDCLVCRGAPKLLPGSQHLKGCPVLCCWHTGYVYNMNWFSTSLAMIHYGSRSLCPHCASATKALPAAGPRGAPTLVGS